MPARSTPLVAGNYPAERLTLGAGVAIFHLASARVVLCYHTRDKYYFLPKGRRNANEDILSAAEREGFEESGYRNRILPLPIPHGQTEPDAGPQQFVTEALWMQVVPNPPWQYILSWYAAETLPAEDEKAYCDEAAEAAVATASSDGQRAGQLYHSPPKFPGGITLQQRIVADVSIAPDGSRTLYEPVRHEGTGVDEEEMMYTSQLMPIDEARRRLRGGVQEDVVRRAWEAVQLRMQMEAEVATAATATVAT